MKILEKEVQLSWAEHSKGAYLLRTNWTEIDPALTWKRYIQLIQIEDAFRICKCAHLGLFSNAGTVENFGDVDEK